MYSVVSNITTVLWLYVMFISSDQTGWKHNLSGPLTPLDLYV